MIRAARSDGALARVDAIRTSDKATMGRRQMLLPMVSLRFGSSQRDSSIIVPEEMADPWQLDTGGSATSVAMMPPRPLPSSDPATPDIPVLRHPFNGHIVGSLAVDFLKFDRRCHLIRAHFELLQDFDREGFFRFE
ncbi:hypothetical protein NKH15_04195 [Mesorhizobium caraganae]